MRLLMRRLSLVPLLARRPAPRARRPPTPPTPGVNIAGIPSAADLDQAQATGAKYVRVFVPGDQPRATTRPSRASRRPRGAHGMKVVLRPHRQRRRRQRAARPGRLRQRRSAPSPPTMQRPAAPPPTRSGTRRTRPTSGARRSTPARYAVDPEGRLPAHQAGRPGRQGPARAARPATTTTSSAQVYAAGAGARSTPSPVHTDTACLVDPPSSFYREDGNVARFTFLGFRTVHDVMVANGDGAKPIWMTELGWTTHDVDLRARHVGRAEALGRHRGRAGRQPQGGLPLPGRLPLRRDRRCGSRSRTRPRYGDELNHYGLQRTDGSHKPSWDAFRSVATQGDQLSGPCGDFDPPVADHQRAGHQRAVRAGR